MEEGTNRKVGRKLLRVVNMAKQSNAPHIDANSNRNEAWVKCGRNNLFREFLRALADNCAPLNNVVNTMGLYIGGRRLVFKDANGEEVVRAAEAWNSLHLEDGEAYYRRAVSKDLALLGDCTVEVIGSRGGGIASIHHIDAMRVRLGKKDEKGRMREVHFCSNWELTSKYSKDYPIIPIPVFGSDGYRSQLKGVIYRKDYHQGQDYYGMPWYLPALTDAETLAVIARFNLTQVGTGFRPAFHLHVFSNRDEADLAELDESIEATFTGEDGKAYIVTMGTQAEGAPQITKLERGDHAGELDKVSERAEQVIYKSCGIPPILMGVSVPTGLGGQALALDQSVTQFMRTQVQPRQWLLTDTALQIVQLMGISEVLTCEVEQLIPFDPAADPALQRQTYLRSRTVNEDRLAGGLGKLTLDGIPEEEGGVLDPKGELLLIEVGGQGSNLNEEEDAEPKQKEEADA